MSYEDIIRKVKGRTVLGYTFKTDIDLSQQLGKYSDYVSYYKRKGFSYEEIIKGDIIPIIKSKTIESKTIDGYTFKTDADLSLQLGKNKNYVNHLKNNKGLSYEEIIRQANKRKTILGYTFVSDRDLSVQLGKASSYVGAMKSKHMSYEEIIKKVTRIFNIGGYTFKSNKDLSLQLGKNNSYVTSLRKKGLSYEDIISKVVAKSNK